MSKVDGNFMFNPINVTFLIEVAKVSVCNCFTFIPSPEKRKIYELILLLLNGSRHLLP